MVTSIELLKSAGAVYTPWALMLPTPSGNTLQTILPPDGVTVAVNGQIEPLPTTDWHPFEICTVGALDITVTVARAVFATFRLDAASTL
jgi:hypothetical protein